MDPIYFQRTLYLSSYFRIYFRRWWWARKRARIVHLEYFKAPRYIERKKKWISQKVPRRELFSPSLDLFCWFSVNDHRRPTTRLLSHVRVFSRANRECSFSGASIRALPRSHAHFVTRRCLASSFLSLFRRCYEQVRVTVSIPVLVDAFVGQ